MFKTLLKTVGVALAAILLILLGTFGYIFGLNQAPRSGPSLAGDNEQIADGFATTYLIPLPSGRVALIDAGNDPSGKPILQALEARGRGAKDVVAIFLTHAHPDHDAAVSIFPTAEIYAMQEEVALAAGSEPYDSPLHRCVGATNPHPFKVTRPLRDQETVTLEGTQVTAFAVPGHTPGSALYLSRGNLFLGDAAGIGRLRQMRPPVYLFSRDAAQGIASLGAALDKLGPRASEVAFVTSSHSGTLRGPEGLSALRRLTEHR